jgi:thiol-disulfide isomerase/thioredoxin
MKKFITIAGICCALPILVFGVWLAINNSKNPTNEQENLTIAVQGEPIPIIGRDHVPEGTKVTNYNSNPPTSGDHWPVPLDWGFYDEVVADEQAVHNLEHGGIWISYKDVDDETKRELKALAEKYNQAVIVSPRPENDTRIAVASWGRLMKLDEFNRAEIESFIKANLNTSPEKLASLEKAKVVRGKLAPEAHFTILSGEDTHLSDFRGQKVMFWVLATWCPSCIAGAQVLQENNEQLANLTIIALKTYGNAGFPGPSIEEFAKRYSPELLEASNWLWGNSSSETTSVYNPRNFPDIYFLIDEKGILKDIDGAPAATINKIIEFANE